MHIIFNLLLAMVWYGGHSLTEAILATVVSAELTLCVSVCLLLLVFALVLEVYDDCLFCIVIQVEIILGPLLFPVQCWMILAFSS